MGQEVCLVFYLSRPRLRSHASVLAFDRLESWVKGARNEPTIITPKLYKNRLRGACEEYFVLAPDHWTTGAQTFSQNVHKV